MLTLATDYILENKNTLLFALESVYTQGDSEDTTNLEMGKLSELDFNGVYLGYNYRLNFILQFNLTFFFKPVNPVLNQLSHSFFFL